MIKLFGGIKTYLIKKQRNSDRHSLAEFLPPILEIQESPPNKYSIWIILTIIFAFMVFVAWVYFGSINIVAVGEGKLIPSSRIKQLQAFEKSMVTDVFVSEGDRVSKGQPVISLDRTFAEADLLNNSQALLDSRMNLLIFRSLLYLMENNDVNISAQDAMRSIFHQVFSSNDELNVDSNIYLMIVENEWSKFNSKLKELNDLLNTNISRQGRASELIKKYEKTLPLATKMRDITQDLFAKNYSSEMDYLKAEQQRVSLEQDLKAENFQIGALKSEEAEIISRIDTFISETKISYLGKANELIQKINYLTEEQKKFASIGVSKTMTSPVNGIVKEIKFSTSGAIVQSGDLLMTIVPIEDEINAEVYFLNKDVGFVEEGMLGSVKVHAFPFSKYGTVAGSVKVLSSDSVEDERIGLVYKATISLDSNVLDVNGKDVDLLPGMQVSAEISTGKRRIYEYFVGTIIKYSNESLRER